MRKRQAGCNFRRIERNAFLKLADALLRYKKSVTSVHKQTRITHKRADFSRYAKFVARPEFWSTEIIQLNDFQS